MGRESDGHGVMGRESDEQGECWAGRVMGKE